MYLGSCREDASTAEPMRPNAKALYHSGRGVDMSPILRDGEGGLFSLPQADPVCFGVKDPFNMT